MACRSEAQKVAGITDKQHLGLSLGREKGTNHRAGYKHKPESREKASISHLKWCSENPDKVAARSIKIRGDNHYQWKGGASRLNTSIRQLVENRKWMDAVKERDGCCLRCGSSEHLESHHKRPLSEIIDAIGIKNRADARKHASILWDLSNGETLCERCHYIEHGRRMAA